MTTNHSTIRFCNCLTNEKNVEKSMHPCKCSNINTSIVPSEPDIKKSGDSIKTSCKCSAKSFKKAAERSSSTKITTHFKYQKTESRKKDVTNIYLPSGPMDFFKACFGKDDYSSSGNLSFGKSEKVKAIYSRSLNLSNIGEKELGAVMLNDIREVTCPHISRRVLCDVKLKIKPGLNVETCSSYWSNKIKNGSEATTSIKVNSKTVSSRTSPKESRKTSVNASEFVSAAMDEKKSPREANIIKGYNERDRRTSPESKTKVPTNHSAQKVNNNDNNHPIRTVSKSDICKGCCLKNHCINFEPSRYVGETTEFKIKPDSTVAVNLDRKYDNYLCKSTSINTYEECNDDTCKDLKEAFKKMIVRKAENDIINQHDKLVSNLNELKPTRMDEENPKNTIFRNTAVQAICTCDAETQEYDIKDYVSSMSKELFCKNTSCEKDCRRCSMIKSIYNGNSHMELYNDDFRTDQSTKPYQIAAIRTNSESEHQAQINPIKLKKSNYVGERDYSNCQQCEEIWRFLSRVEVVTLATFFVCMLFYLCFNKMFQIFNQSNCRRTFC